MKAMVFAAGIGSRLRPYTLMHPKALAPVCGVPMLERVIVKLRDAGIRQMVVNVHHFSQQIVDFLRENHNFGIEITVSDETALLLDTGGGLLAARRWLDDDNLVVHNADILCDFPIEEMIQAHTASPCLATLLVAERDTSRYLLIDRNDRMQGWTDVRTGQVLPASLSGTDDLASLSRRAFGGVHVVSPEIFPLLQSYAHEREAFPIMPFYIDCCRDHVITGFEPTAPYRWFDIGKPDTLALATRSFQTP